MIQRLDPTDFDTRINELAQKQRLAKESAKEAITAREEADRMVIQPKSLVEEILPPVKASHAELLRRAMKNLRRLDSQVIWSILHKDIYQAIIDILNCNELGIISEACYLIHDKLPRVERGEMVESDYFYEVDHGEYLGHESWARLVQSQLLHNREDMNWVGVPIVQNNRYKIVKSYNVHIRVTAYIMHCTDHITT